MAKKRRLSDLYVRGDFLEFDDGQGDTVRIWVRKMAPTMHEKAMKRANAARAQVLAASRDHSSDLYVDVKAKVSAMDNDDILDYLVEERLGSRRAVIEAELAAEEPWSEEGYLEGLQEAWTEELSEKHLLDPDDDDANRVLGELRKFNDELEKRVAKEREAIEKDLSSKSPDNLDDLAAEKLIETQASLAWLTEFRLCEVWLSVYEEDGKTQYFESRDEVDMLSVEVLREIQSKYRELSVDPTEGKG